jgi:hypothetical protein
MSENGMVGKGGHRDGPACAHLQSHPCNEHHEHPAAHDGNEGVVIVAEPPKKAGASASEADLDRKSRQTGNAAADRHQHPDRLVPRHVFGESQVTF